MSKSKLTRYVLMERHAYPYESRWEVAGRFPTFGAAVTGQEIREGQALTGTVFEIRTYTVVTNTTEDILNRAHDELLWAPRLSVGWRAQQVLLATMNHLVNGGDKYRMSFGTVADLESAIRRMKEEV